MRLARVHAGFFASGCLESPASLLDAAARLAELDGRAQLRTMVLKTAFTLVKDTAKEWSDDNASSLAASVAFYTLVSLAPLLLVVVAIAGFVFGPEAARGELFGQIAGLIGVDAAKVVEAAIDNAGKNEKTGLVASAINLVVLLFGATGAFAELQYALNTIWGVRPKDVKETKATIWNYLRKRGLSFAMILVLGFLLLVSLVLSAAIAGITGALRGVVPGVGLLWQPLRADPTTTARNDLKRAV